MGQCYNVTLKIKVRDERGAVRALQEKLAKGKAEHTEYNVETFRAEGTGTERIDDLVRIFLAGYKNIPFHSFSIENKGKFTVYTSEFNACYGWEAVMLDFFEVLAPFLDDLSWIKVWPDSGLDYGIVTKEKLVWRS